MKTIMLNLNSIDKVKSFVNTAVNFDFDINLISDNYVVNGKSILGIFSLDLAKPVEIRFHCEEPAALKAAQEAVAPYMTEA